MTAHLVATTTGHYGAVARIAVAYSGGMVNRGSGVMLGEQDVLTAAHLFDDPRLGTVVAVQVETAYGSAGWTHYDGNPVNRIPGVIDFGRDYAVVGLDAAIPGPVAAIAAFDPSRPVEVVGFPGGGPLMADIGPGVLVDAEGIAVRAWSIEGQSGAPMLQDGHVVAVLAGGNWAGESYGSVITPAAIAQIDGWQRGNGFGEPSAGPDHIVRDSSADRIAAGSGNDTVDAGGGADVVLGGPGSDVLIAGAGNDLVDGGRGNDTISGGPGDDTLGGGGDYDLFLLGRGFGRDVVTDFAEGDRVAIEAGVSWRISGELVVLDDGSSLQLLGHATIAADWILA